MQHIEITLDQLTSTLAGFGIELPTDAANAIATLAAIRSASAGLTLATAENRAAQAVTDGKITPKNAEAKLTELATRMLATDKAREAAQLFTHPLLRRARDAIRTHRDELAVALRVPFDAAAAQLHEYGPQVEPGADLAELVREGGSQAVAAYETVSGSSAALDQVARTCSDLRALSGVSADTDASWFVDPDSVADDAALDRALFAYASPSYRRSGAVSRFHSLVHAGFRLRLNLPAEAHELVDTTRRTASTRDQQEQVARRIARQRNEVYVVGPGA